MKMYPSSKQQKFKNIQSNRNFSIPVQQSIINTKLCSHNLLGRCTKNDRCCFAHSLTELRDPPNFYKTRLCVDFMKSIPGCSKSSNCKFAHGNFELRSTPRFYKTSLCAFWKMHFYCPFGDFCRWAHGVSDLRRKVDYLAIIYNQRKERTCKNYKPINLPGPPKIFNTPKFQTISYLPLQTHLNYPQPDTRTSNRLSSGFEEFKIVRRKSCPDVLLARHVSEL